MGEPILKETKINLQKLEMTQSNLFTIPTFLLSSEIVGKPRLPNRFGYQGNAEYHVDFV